MRFFSPNFVFCSNCKYNNKKYKIIYIINSKLMLLLYISFIFLCKAMLNIAFHMFISMWDDFFLLDLLFNWKYYEYSSFWKRCIVPFLILTAFINRNTYVLRPRHVRVTHVTRSCSTRYTFVLRFLCLDVLTNIRAFNGKKNKMYMMEDISQLKIRNFP